MQLIDRDKLLKTIPNEEMVARMAVMSAPTVDAQPVRHGHWIYISFDYENQNALYNCSECGCGEVHCPEVDTKYCWNCGAKMDGEQEKQNDKTD